MLCGDRAQELRGVLGRREAFGASGAHAFPIVQFHVDDDTVDGVIGECHIVFLRECRVLQLGDFVAQRCREDHLVAEPIFSNRYDRAQLVAEIAQKFADALPECDDVRLHGDRDDAVGQLRQLRCLLAVQAVPVALRRVTRRIAASVRVVRLAELLVVAWQQFGLAVAPIEQALRVVALLVAVAVIEHLPAADRRRAIAPRIDAERTVAAVEVARVRIAVLIAHAIPLLLQAAVFHALSALSLQVQFDRLQSRVVRRVSAVLRIVFVACFARPRCRTQATEIVQLVDACSAAFARIRLAFIVRIDLTVGAAGSERTLASIAAAIEHLTRARVAWIRVAIVAGELAVFAIETISADAMMAIVLRRTESAVLARRRRAQVHFDLAMASHVTGFAAAVVVVDQLDAVKRARIGARIRQALVDVALAFRAHEAGRTPAVVAAHLVDARTIVVARVRLAVVRVDFAVVAERSGRARANAAVDQIVARATVSARIRFAVVDVELTVLALESFAANALIRADQILARAPILARCRFAFVDLLLAVRAHVALHTVAFVRIAEILARPVVAQMIHVHALPLRRILAGHHFNVAQPSRPATGTQAFVCVLTLLARRSVVARVLGTPVDVFGALFSRVTVRTVARVVVVVVAARRSVLAGLRVAFVDLVLAVGASVAGGARARVRVDAIQTGAFVHARALRAVLVVRFAVHAREAERTAARVRVDVLLTGGAILARERLALVDVHLAVLAFEAVQAEACVVADAVETGAAVLAWERRTVVRVHGAVTSLIALGADALVRAGHILARGAIATRRR